MASTKPCLNLLRRPLPPVNKKEANRSSSGERRNADGDEKRERYDLEVFNSLMRQTTRQKTDDLLLQEAKMRQYKERLQLLLFREKPKGIYPFPLRSPKKSSKLDFNLFIDDSYEPTPPIFTLDDFLHNAEDYSKLNQCEIETPKFKERQPKFNTTLIEKPLLLCASQTKNDDKHYRTHANCSSIMLDQNVILPELPERKPIRQQFLEEKVELLESFADDYFQELQKSIPVLRSSVARPTFVSKDKKIYIGSMIDREDTIYEESTSVQSFTEEDIYKDVTLTNDSNNSQTGRPFSIDADIIRSNDSVADELDIVLVNSPPMYFQGERSARSPSPFEPIELRGVFPADLAVLDCAVHGGTKLNLKAHFIDTLPDIAQLSRTLTHVNLSFNDFSRIPTEICHLMQLKCLKMRNNPIYEVPREIKNLKSLQVLVLSFCCISSLPPSLFKLQNLESLDLSYNKISFISEEMKALRNLQVLNLEGNQLTSFPRSILQLNLRVFNVTNNFTHHLFWKATAPPQPQSLLECCATFLAQTNQHFDIPCVDAKLNAFLNTISLCDFCGGPKFGQGVRVVKPAIELFGVRNLPIIFYVCSQSCRRTLRISAGVSLSPEVEG